VLEVLLVLLQVVQMAAIQFSVPSHQQAAAVVEKAEVLVALPVVREAAAVQQEHQAVQEQQIKVTQAAMFQVPIQTQAAVAAGPVLLEVQYQQQLLEPLAVMVLVQQLMVALQHAQAAVVVQVRFQTG
jgi:hypothetical protein